MLTLRMILTVLEHYARWQVQGIQKLSGQLLGYSYTTTTLLYTLSITNLVARD
jgi:hypothetical protein